MKKPEEYNKTIKEAAEWLVIRISELKDEVKQKESVIEELENEINEMPKYDIPNDLSSLRVVSCLDELLDNLNRIPIEDIENLVNKYKL